MRTWRLLAAAAAVVAAAAARPGAAADETALPALDDPAGEPAPAAGAPLAPYREVLERPLFSPTRRPEPVAAESVARTRRDAVPRLWGVMLTMGRRIALIGSGEESALHRVSEGGEIGRWTVERIEVDRIVFRAGDGTKTTVRLWTDREGA